MSDELPTQDDIEEIKERLKVEIPVAEDDADQAQKGADEAIDVVAELRRLGRQVGETFRTAWESEERQKIEGEIREGVKHFAAEVNKAFQEVQETPAAQKAREEAGDIKSKVESAELTAKARRGLAQGLGWLSEEFGKLATQFTPPQPEPAGDPEPPLDPEEIKIADS